jgi:outer membrane protein OmpA-like peptidoglycan-associated protein
MATRFPEDPDTKVVMAEDVDHTRWDDSDSVDPGAVGPWPGFVDLFAATSLVFLVFFVVIAARYVGEVGDVVRVRNLIHQLAELESSAGSFVVQQQGPDVLLILEESVTFETGRATLLPTVRGTLAAVVRLLQRDTFRGLVREVEILGHADPRGNSFANWGLSAERAVAVAQFLVDSLRVNPCIILASGLGSYFPRDSTANADLLPLSQRDAFYARDRRVEILLHPAVAKARSARRVGCRGA